MHNSALRDQFAENQQPNTFARNDNENLQSAQTRKKV